MKRMTNFVLQNQLKLIDVAANDSDVSETRQSALYPPK